MITENSPVIRAIQNSSKIEDETALLAINEILSLEERNSVQSLREVHDGRGDGFNPDATDVDELFLWEESELGVQFWSSLQDDVFEAAKRTC
jgi:hypothetical protein